MMFGYGHSGWSGWEIALMWAGMIALVALLVWAVTRTVSGRRSDRAGDDPDAPGRILDERLARGEIDAGEYARLRDALNSGRAKPPTGAGSRN
ncbi:MAG: SHOCT domain-containing protein [Actinomycetota bacterium]|nr:SHOCT domain-containing protein [Actinomycetota bacterium]